MRRSVGVLVTVFLVVLLSAGVALAASPSIISGTNHDDQIKGTQNADTIYGLEGSDEITGGLGADVVYGGKGADNLIGYGGDTSVNHFYGGAGDDIIQSRNVPASKDYVNCGSGVDRVYADKADVVSGDCEKVKAW